MDHFGKVGDPGFNTPCFTLVSGALFTYYFGHYALTNPDAATCWSNSIGTTSGVFVDNSQTDVTANFHAYFLIQFVSCLAGLATGAV